MSYLKKANYSRSQNVDSSTEVYSNVNWEHIDGQYQQYQEKMKYLKEKPKLIIGINGQKKNGKTTLVNTITKVCVDFSGDDSTRDLIRTFSITETIIKEYEQYLSTISPRPDVIINNKEIYRIKRWEKIRQKHGHYFIMKTILDNLNEKPLKVKPLLWIFEDIRTFKEFQYLKSMWLNIARFKLESPPKVFKLNVVCNYKYLITRGWSYVLGVDNQPYETELITYPYFDHVINTSVPIEEKYGQDGPTVNICRQMPLLMDAITETMPPSLQLGIDDDD